MEMQVSDVPTSLSVEGYEIQEKIGQGGFGRIYKAVHSATGQYVAIKYLTLNVDFDDAKRKRYVDRFERETVLVSRLQHPNIVRLLDKGECGDNQFYAVFEYVDGVTLKDMLSQAGPFSAPEAADVMSQVLDALVHAHEQGVIHRDIKPSNIMLTKVGAKTHVKILDFGIGSLTKEARQLEYQTLTLTQETLGTPSYSAPEQLRGEPPTPKTDLYVWGLVFLECLTGQPAISGSSLASIFHKQLSPSNVPLPASVAGHPVADLLRRVLNKKASDRVSSASEIYQGMRLINFSTLVGDLQTGYGAGSDLSSSAQCNPKDLTVTLAIDNQAHLYTGLTEKKKISVLAVLIDIHSNAQANIDGGIDDEVGDALLRDQKSQCIDIAIRYGAFHVGTLASSLLFYFGYPVVSDSDSRLCARTALEISSNMRRKNALLKNSQGYEFDYRMGINTGLVITYADAIPDGRIVSLAMNIAYEAAPQQVLCSNASKAELDGYISFKPENNRRINSTLESARFFQLTGERTVEAFGFLRGTRANYDFVGRERELVKLTSLLTGAQRGTAVHVYGEAGIGKSRLVNEFRNRANNFQHIIAQCLPEYSFNALYPILEALKYQYSLNAMEPERAVSVLSEVLFADSCIDSVLALPLLCSWLCLPFSEEAKVMKLTADVQKELIFGALISLFLKGNQERGLQVKCLFIFEDMHWADPTSIEFINYFLNHSSYEKSRTVCVTTSREVVPDELENAVLTPIEVVKFSLDKINDFLVSLFDGRPISKRVLDVVASRADGIPLFVEELAIMLRRKNLVEYLNGVFDFVTSEKVLEVPYTLLGSLQQKLDTLGSSKETAQLAATIGREFDYGLLVASSVRSEEQVQIDLNELVANELIYLQRQVAGDRYIFKHALVRDAAYEGMANRMLINCHKNIADSLVDDFPERAGGIPAIIARHYFYAGLVDKASVHGVAAVEQQVEKSANDEAAAFGEQVLQWIPTINDQVLRCNNELKILAAMLPAVLTVSGYGGEKVMVMSRRIKELVEQLNQSDGKSGDEFRKNLSDKSDWILLLSLHYTSKRDAARVLGEEILARAKLENDRQKTMLVLAHLAQAFQLDDEWSVAASQLEEALGMYDEAIDRQLANEFGVDVKAQGLAMLSFSYLYGGDPNKALKTIGQAIRFSEEIGHDSSIAFAYLYMGLYGFYIGDISLVKREMANYKRKHNKSREEVWHTIFIDTLEACANKEVVTARECVDEMIASGQDFVIGWYTPFLAKVYIEVGEPDSAIQLMELVKNIVFEKKIVGVYSVVLISLADCYYQRDKELTDRVKKLLVQAVTHSNRHGEIYFEAEAIVYYIRLAGADVVPELVERLESLYQIFEAKNTGKKVRVHEESARIVGQALGWKP